MPADPNCPYCGGLGHIFLDAMTSKRCSCLLKNLYARKMGRMLWSSKALTSSPLLGREDENLFLLYDDEDINPHLRLVFIKMGLDAQWIYIDDSNVLQAAFGNTNSAGADNITDLTMHPFMVLRLGTVGYKNKALPGYINELLKGRALAYNPTWIVSPREINPETCLEYSDELLMILGRYYDKLFGPPMGGTSLRGTTPVGSSRGRPTEPEEVVLDSHQPTKQRPLTGYFNNKR